MLGWYTVSPTGEEREREKEKMDSSSYHNELQKTGLGSTQPWAAILSSKNACTTSIAFSIFIFLKSSFSASPLGAPSKQTLCGLGSFLTS